MPDPYEIAAWRFEQIAPLIDPSLSEAQPAGGAAERTAKPVPRPWDEEAGTTATSAREANCQEHALPLAGGLPRARLRGPAAQAA